MKNKKPSYSPVSPLATAFGLAVTGVASLNPITATAAAPLGTAATGILGGVDLTDEEMTIKDKFDEAINKTWDQIYADYKLTDVCFLKLRQEVIGESTSTDEFVNNSQRKKLEESYALAIQTILKKYKGGLEHKSKKTWDDEYIANASKDIASRLMDTLNSVFEEDDLVKILKAIADRSENIKYYISESREVEKLEHNQLIQLILELKEDINRKTSYPNVPLSLTTLQPTIHLIGRDEDIQDIRDLFKQHNIVSVHADGGVGKTAVAIKIANEIKDEMISGKSPYQHIAWIISSGDLKHDLIGLNIPSIVATQSEDEKYQAVYSFLQATPSFLVIDNMDEPPTDDEADILNTIAWKTKILITSRAVIPYVENYDLKELDPESALILFYSHYQKGKKISIQQIKDRKDYPFAREIVEAAVYNALFIELIGKTACVDHLQLDALWRKLETNVFGQDFLHAIHTNHAKSHHRNKDTLLTQIQKLYVMSNLSEKQKEIMSFIALFPPEHSIFFDVFKWAGFEDDKEDHLGALQDRGWIDRDDEGYLIHTMVQGSVRLQSDKRRFDEERYEILIDELSDTKQYIPQGMVYTKVRERIVVPETVCELLASNGSEKKNTARLFNNIAGVYCTQGNYEKALEYYEKALAIREKVLGKEHSSTATTYNNMAGVYEDQGNYEKALEYNEKALVIKEKVLGKENPSTAITYGNMAVVYEDQGNYEKALEYNEKALVISEKVLGKEHPSTATMYHNMAGVYHAQGNYEKALEYYEKALVISEKVLGKEHPSTATTYHNMAGLYHAQGNYEKALEYYEKALVIQEKVLGKEHPSTATTYGNMAGVYKDQGNYERALEYYEKDRIISEKVLGKEHPSTATTYHNLAGLYHAQGNYEKALEYYEKDRAISEKVFGKEHPSTATTYNNMAGLYHAQGNYEKALEYYEKAVKIFDEKLGPEHPYTKSVREELEDTKQALTRN